MSDGPELPGPSTCERCGRPASSALLDHDGTRLYYCVRCLRIIFARIGEVLDDLR